jgi:hypothetical protein
MVPRGYKRLYSGALDKVRLSTQNLQANAQP